MQWEMVLQCLSAATVGELDGVLRLGAQGLAAFALALCAYWLGIIGQIIPPDIASPADQGASLDNLYLAAAGAMFILILWIARRIYVLNKERDAALDQAQTLGALSERDPLTGLMNRRALEERFRDLRLQGFDTFALIDLDRFKQVNDRFGHQIGDAVLIACADALSGKEDRDHLAVRLGGEEFVVLLRGSDAFERAEALRKSLPHHIAAEVSEIDQQVTASMGLIELPRTSYEISSFSELYSRADELLYHAKASGRDRSCFERLKVFTDAPVRKRA